MAQKILYIAGAGRSGSLLLNNILGQVPGFFGCGEMYHLYRTPLTQRYCSCGSLISECEIWKEILGRTVTADLSEWQKWMLGARNRFARTRYLMHWLVSPMREQLLQLSEEYRHQLRALYLNIALATESKVMVDASKVATYAVLLSRVKDLEVYIVHLVRDARAVAYSWQRKKRVHTPVGEIEAPVVSPLHGMVRWIVHNLAVELCRRKLARPYIRLQYEQVVHSPREAVTKLLNFIGETDDLSFIQGRAVTMGIQHNVGGNPSRFQRGQVCLNLDNEWEKQMSRPSRALVTMLGLPLLRYYRYI